MYYKNYICGLNEGIYDYFTNNFNGKLNKELSDKIIKITKDDKVKVYIVKDEKNLPNAFNAGGSQLYITSKAIQLFTEKETIAVLLHEYGHRKYYHVLISNTFSGITMATCATIITAYLFSLGIITNFGIIIGFIMGKFPGLFLDRHFEYTADSYATKMGYGQNLSSALVKMHDIYKRIICSKSSNKKECILKFDTKTDLFSTHPSTQKRLNRISKIKILKVVTHIVKIFAISNKFGDNKNA